MGGGHWGPVTQLARPISQTLLYDVAGFSSILVQFGRGQVCAGGDDYLEVVICAHDGKLLLIKEVFLVGVQLCCKIKPGMEGWWIAMEGGQPPLGAR